MTTPAIAYDEQRTETFHYRGFNNGIEYPNLGGNQSVVVVEGHRHRPESVGGEKLNGLWPLKPYYHDWCRIQVLHKSWQVANRSTPGSVRVFENTPYFGGDLVFKGAKDVAPFLNRGLFPVDLENRCRTDFLNELSGTKWELGTTLAEARETAEYLRDLASAVHGWTRALAKRAGTSTRKVKETLTDPDVEYLIDQMSGVWTSNPKKRRKEAKNARKRAHARHGRQTVDRLASGWLGYQLGLQPMLHDLADATVHLTNLRGSEQNGMRMRCSVTRGDETTKTSDHSVDATIRLGMGHIDWKIQSRITIVGDYVVDDVMLRTNRQLGLTSQLALGYEVTRFSWLLDYLVDVGGWIKSLDAPLGLRPLGASISRTQTLSVLQYRPESSRMILEGILPYRDFDAVDIGRSVRVLEPMVYPGLPPLGDMLKVTQAINALAVLQRLF